MKLSLAGKRPLVALVLPAPGAGAPRLALAPSAAGEASSDSFALDASLSLDEPQALGQALGEALRGQGLRAGGLVVGLPAHAVMTRVRELPAVEDADARLDLLRLAAEQASPDGALAIDAIDHGAGRPVVLVSTAQETVDAAKAVAQSAGLALAGVAPTRLIAAMHHDHDGIVGADVANKVIARVWADPAAPEVVWVSADATAQTLACLGVSSLPAAPRADADGQAPTADAYQAWAEASGRSVFTRGMAALPSASGVHLMSTRPEHTGVDAHQAALALAAIEGRSGHKTGASVDAAVELALAWSSLHERGVVAPNLAANRLAPPAAPRWDGRRRKIALGVVAALSLVGGAAWLAYAAVQDVRQLEARLAEVSPVSDAVEQTRTRVRAARPWFDNRPAMLRALAELTRAAPADGSVWATRLRIEDTGEASFTGKAKSRQAMLVFLERLRAAEPFDQVQLKRWTDGGDDAPVSFEVSLVRAMVPGGAS